MRMSREREHREHHEVQGEGSNQERGGGGTGGGVQAVAGVIPIQPRPLLTLVARGVRSTGVARLWPPGSTRRCHLCRTCTAAHKWGICLVLVDGKVSNESAPLLSDRRTRPLI